MNEALLVALAGAMALFMVTLVRAEFSPDLRAAIRTTFVVILGWFFAYTRYGLKPWTDLTWQVKWMLALSAVAIILAWLLYLRSSRTKTGSRLAVMDCINVGMAALFTALLLLQQASTQSALIGFILVSGALVLAFGSR